MEIDISLIIDDYKKKKAIYELNTEKNRALISDLIKVKNIPIHSISSRTKSIDSLSRKLSTKSKYSELTKVTDLSGVRICCYFSSQVDEVAKLIRANFKVNSNLSVNKRAIIDPDKFGYLSLHFVVNFSRARGDLPEYKKYKNLYCEIQIRTVLQHAWAEIEHDLGYKSDIEIPRSIRRKFNRLAGLLELGDEQFVEIKLQLEKYTKEIKKKMVAKPKEVLIDKLSLTNFITTSLLVKRIEKKIAYSCGSSISGAPMISEGVRICDYFGIRTIDVLENILNDNNKEIFKFATKFIGKDYGQPLKPGTSVFYIGYLFLLLRTRTKGEIQRYLSSIFALPSYLYNKEIEETVFRLIQTMDEMEKEKKVIEAK